MPSISRNALVPYSAAEMFSLVNDVEAYSLFLPWCSATRVISRTEDEVKAAITVSKGAIQKEFATRNLLQQDKMIEMRLLEGPFKLLEGFWRFESLGDEGSKVSFDLEFEFSNRLIGMAFGPVFNQVAGSLVDAFRERAEQLYGKR